MVAVGRLPAPPAIRAVLVLAIVTAAVLWVAEGLGGMLTGGGTDPNSGPLLALLAVAYWPWPPGRVASRAARPDASTAGYWPGGAVTWPDRPGSLTRSRAS